MSNRFFEKIEQIVRDYLVVQMRIKKFQEIGFAVGKSGEQLDETRIRDLLKTVDKDPKNVEKYIKAFGRSHGEGWAEFSKDFLTRYTKEQSIDIQR